MTASFLRSLDRTTLRARCLDALRSAITAGQFAPGDHLSEVELANTLGVSRATIREALRHLEQDGLAVATPRGMLRVRETDACAIRELYAVRGALEALAGETLAGRRDRRGAVTALHAAVARLDTAEGDLPAQVEADLAFHVRLCELAGNATLLRHWRSLEGPIRVTIMHAGPARALHNMAAARHRPIVTAIESGDRTATRDTIARHMTEAAERLVTAARPNRDGEPAASDERAARGTRARAGAPDRQSDGGGASS